MPQLLALETSCDETAAAIVRDDGAVLSSEIASQIEAHRRFGGVVPELASRNHVLHARSLVERALAGAGLRLRDIDAFAATSGPGLVSSLLIGSTLAKALALAERKPFLAINHLEGHLLSPFLSVPAAIPNHVALVVSGGHTLLLHVRGLARYELLGRTRDDAAGEAFDKVAKMLGLPYPGGPEIDRRAREGNPAAFDLPRSMMGAGPDFSFSGLKTAVLYLLPKVDRDRPEILNDLCASFQEAVVDVLVEKAVAAARGRGAGMIAVSGGVSCNSRLRRRFAERCASEGFELRLAEPRYTTDNAAMIAFAALRRWQAGFSSGLDTDVDPNLGLDDAQGAPVRADT